MRILSTVCGVLHGIPGFLIGSFPFFFLLFSCSPSSRDEVEWLNAKSYSYHYRNLDSTEHYARKALILARHDGDGRAEALNNLAFVSIARMRYRDAAKQLDSIPQLTDNQVELLIADIQQMRLCQRESRNKDFYEYYERARHSLHRIDEERTELSPRMQRRMVYAESELAIVASTYYYYIGQQSASQKALQAIDEGGDIRKDTAQYLNYLYQVGSGGIITDGTQDDINQHEWDYLMNCYLLAKYTGEVYWEANALQGLSEHMFDKHSRKKLIADNLPAMKFINSAQVPDSLLAGYLAERSLGLFQQYGDVYQTAGAYRTLASCYWALGDYNAAGYYLDAALHSSDAIPQAPDLVASIHERLSMTYSAIDSTARSNLNRNIYLDMQDSTRQDRMLEARAEQLSRSSSQLNVMILAVVLMIVAVVFFMFLFDHLRRKKDSASSLSSLLEPLQEWKNDNEKRISELSDRYEEIHEQQALNDIRLVGNKRRNMENRAKVFLVNSVTPFIDRIIHETNRLKTSQESSEVRKDRYDYIAELTDRITDYNNVLTQWIQLQQGQLSLHIESFRVQELFDMVARSRMSFQLKGVSLMVVPTDDVVKADKILTLFMINTMADNARKFTPQGGTVTIGSRSTADYVEISVQDTGTGISAEQLSSIFEHKVKGGHGFGLMNCKGIIEKYRKVSQIFQVCTINAESEQGRGSRFFFRLPKGVLRLLLPLLMLMGAAPALGQAEYYADAVYNSNISGDYRQAVLYADSALACLNQQHLRRYPHHDRLLVLNDSTAQDPAEIQWFRDSMQADYDLIVFLRNEIAVAALALHQWPLYQYNNKVYTQLYKEKSADRHLGEYVRIMQRSEVNKTIAVVLLVLLLVVILVAYYVIYYRHRVYYRFCVEQIEHINEMLLSDSPDEQKLATLVAQRSVVDGKWPPQLQAIVDQIEAALKHSIEVSQDQRLSIELAEDELRRAEYENDKLYVCNNVLDNCLSTLKHETMYYPSRIRQLVDGPGDNIAAIDEVASYYKELYALLSAQAMRQVSAVRQECRPFTLHGVQLMGDEAMVRYLFELLARQAGAKNIMPEISEKEDKYVIFKVEMPRMPYRDLFVPSMQNIPFLICRQIARDNGESTNSRGCGITASPTVGGGTVVTVTLARYGKV